MKGTLGYKKIIVKESMSAKNMGSGTLDVYATPSLIALIEETCWKSIVNFIDKYSTTVGTYLDIKHLKASKIGSTVVCNTEVLECQGRKIIFSIKVIDGDNIISEGRHERFIVNTKKFLEKI